MAGGIDLAHGPAGKAVEAGPVLAEDEAAEGVGELGVRRAGPFLLPLSMWARRASVKPGRAESPCIMLERRTVLGGMGEVGGV